MHPAHRVVEKRGANHALHLVISLLTCGLWAITGWPIAAAMGRKSVTHVPMHPQLPPQQPPYGYPQQQGPYGQQQFGPPPGATPPYGYQPPGQYPPQQ